AYALDALEPDEAAAYEAHLGQCERCRADLAALSETAASLAWAVEAPAPPDALRTRILTAAAAERANVVPLAVRRPWLFRATAAAAAVAVCVAVGVGVWAGSLSRSLDHERSARSADARAVEILADRASRRIGLSGGNGLIAVAPDGEGVLVVRRLAPAPSGRTYEAWVVPQGGTPKPAGLFRGGGASTIVRLGGSVPAGAKIGVTVERAGGAAAPTQAPILTAQA
ncbi:MAG: anti-sigma factor, partial [Gaiellaceae bacterium]